MANTILSSGVRNNLLTLQQTTAQQGVLQNRLATGKKVNSAIDNPVNFFTSLALGDRAGQLTGLLDGISNGIQTIQAASKGIDSITKLVNSLQSTVKQAQAEAATNRPKIVGTQALASPTDAATRGSSVRDASLNKFVLDGNGATANTTSATYAGNLGVVAFDTGATPAESANTVRLQAGNTTYSFNITSTTTVRDMVNEINKSGIATASVSDTGTLTVTGTGSDALTTEVGVTDANGFTGRAADTNALLGAGVVIADVAGSGTSAVRSSLIKQFNDLRDQLDALARDAGFNGTNLLGGDQLSITFNEKTGTAKNKLDIQGETITSANLGIDLFVDSSTSQTGGNFGVQNDTDLGKAADALTNTLTSLRSIASTLGSNLSVVQTRQDFTKELVNTLTIGADNLVAADPNAEGASLLALNTRQQLSQTALSLANQADQGVLRLFQ